MSTSYDIDHELEAEAAAFRAIRARVQGVWDDPDLMAVGPLDETLARDIVRITDRAYTIEWPKREK